MADTYVGVWPVEDPNATLSSLISEAERQYFAMVAEAGVTLCGTVTWSLSGDRLTASAPAATDRPAKVLPWDGPHPETWLLYNAPEVGWGW